MRLLALLSVIPLAFPAPCVPVDRDQIRMADLASQFLPFSRLDPELAVGLAPVPGAHRTFSGHELTAIAERNGVQLEVPVPNVCFERRLQPLTPERVLSAIQSSLGTSDARIEIVDFSRQPLPSGDLAFPHSGLTPPAANASAPALWRGTLKYNPQHTVAVWASVRIHEERPVVVATRQIRYGAAIAAEDVALVRRDLFPLTPHIEVETGIVGRIARRTIPAGAVISDELFEIAPDIVAGDTVYVVATNGSARITFEAVARSRGRKGERIVLLNPESHRTFRALVDGKARAHIDAGT
jgi:flagella basal body P-ring formation protein FlgA